MSAGRDYYEVLGVARDADAATIKSSFRKLAMKLHPDQNPGCKVSEDKFKEIGEAYSVLSDPEKRAAYDRYGKAAFQGGGPGGGFGGAAGAGDFSDLFNEIFGGGFEEMFSRGGRAGPRNGPQRGNDLRYDVEITLEQAFRGSEREIVVPRAQACEPCGGTGSEGKAPLETCATCQGAGQVRASQGMFRIVRTCPACHGRGQSIKTPCKSCGGRGLTQKERTLSVKIPAGVEDGTRIRLAGEGDGGIRNGPPGDLYLFLSVKPHALFERDGADLYCRAPAPMCKAALGGEMEIPTIDGDRAKVTIPAGAQTGRRFRLKGKGMTHLRGKDRGDLHVELLVETPVNLTAKQKKLLEEFSKDCTEEAHPQSKGFFDSMKHFFEANTEPPTR
ncbi:molecular chaperone DnaJ [Terricaulis silvestris]|uniref:Chaperone protein DnaJ n=1 Tax=Terricaulis silvestris TaxID=2686094 RepID=A0A6I6MUE0_9CAUL|nr:molecular chaperone DnaJ [Terricaulis silvestris]QGZ96998.1 Chaperone protein DnaJ [Terricaulis silvestris]